MNTINTERLEKNIIDNIHEAQLKLGYDGRPVSLNYTPATLRHLTGSDDMGEISEAVKSCSPGRLGAMEIRPVHDIYCITVPAEGTAYVNALYSGDNGFLCRLVGTVREHGISLDDVLAVFRSFSDNVAVKESGSEEFDYLVYFEDGVPDEYYYCLTLEPCMGGGCHITYHRFIREDYEDLNF
ncbi:MAG: DUF3877 family protein [Ruminococcus sp.]|nr:DUF3877 family protein [Ruminococcus sp.]